MFLPKPFTSYKLSTALAACFVFGATTSQADESIQPDQLGTLIESGSTVEYLLNTLNEANFYISTDRYTIREGQLVAQDGINAGVLTVHHPVLLEGFLKNCEVISCTFLYSRKTVLSIFGLDHKYHYFWMLDQDRVVDSLADHRTWVWRK